MVNVNQKKFNKSLFVIFAISAALFSLFANNLLPFFKLPTLGQAFWAVGFAQSLANGSLFTVHASNFGYPFGANISFGLSAVYPMSILIRLGFSPANSYIVVFCFYLILSFISAYKISRYFKVNQYSSILLSSLWLITPVVVQHANYSMLTLGVALLPFYFLTFLNAVNLCERHSDFKYFTLSLLMCTASSIISIFMDGYTFVMLAVLNSFYLLYFLIVNDKKSAGLTIKLITIHAFSLLFAYTLYALFIGKTGYKPQQLSFFRSWGVDISFLFTPSFGISWLLDNLHLSVFRTEKQYYGDSSVWRTTFLLPMLILGFYLLITSKVNENKKVLTLFFIVLIFSLYFSLGPSLKFMVLKPSGESDLSPIIPDSYHLLSTGSGWISEHLPGFNVMRASYRWIALTFFAMWCLIVLLFSLRKNHISSSVLIFLVILLYIPSLDNHSSGGNYYKNAFSRVDTEVVNRLKSLVSPGELIAFVPWGNDFLTNYLSSVLNVKSYNLGGDKNVHQALGYWPDDFLKLRGELTDPGLKYIVRLLSFEKVHAVIIPNFDMLWSAHVWPCKMSDTPVQTKLIYPDFNCPDVTHSKLLPLINRLKKEGYLDITQRELFTVVRLKKNVITYPISFSSNSLEQYRTVGNGWYEPEERGTWSTERADLILPPTEGGELRLNFQVFSSSASNPKKVIFHVKLSNRSYIKKFTSTGGNEYLDLTVDKKDTTMVSFEVVDAISPSESGSNDLRVLGLFMCSIVDASG